MRARLTVLLAASTWACNSLEPPPPPASLEKTSGDGQNWYFNNPLPAPLAVTVRDLTGQVMSDVRVVWKNPLGGGTLSADTTFTTANGVATTDYTLGSTTVSVVTATVSNLPSVGFTEHASAPPTTADVSVTNDAFTADSVVVQSGGTVTWTWNSGATEHTVTYTGGPTPLPTSSGLQSGTSTFATTFTNVGTYTYHCTQHPTLMMGQVVVVQ
jgi:plastocyanin